VLSHDASSHNAWLDAEAKALLAPQARFTHISEQVLPALLERGVTEAQIEQMLVTNPRNILAG
jgi:phosphotriesterase-related protein